MAPSPRPKGDISETTFIELTHTAINFLPKSANILESAVDPNDSSSVDKFLASAHSHASVRALLLRFRTDSPLATVLRLFTRISAPTAPREITSRDSPYASISVSRRGEKKPCRYLAYRQSVPPQKVTSDIQTTPITKKISHPAFTN